MNYRYAPTQTPAEAEAAPARADRSFGETEVTVIGNAPPGRVAVRNPLVERLRAAGGLTRRTQAGVDPRGGVRRPSDVDAINFGPGDPQYAHRDDERVDTSALVRSYEVLRAFLAATETEGEG